MVLKRTAALGNPEWISATHFVAYFRMSLGFRLIASEWPLPLEERKNKVWAEVDMEGFAQVGKFALLNQVYNSR